MLFDIFDLLLRNLLGIVADHDLSIVVVAPTGACLLVDHFLCSILR